MRQTLPQQAKKYFWGDNLSELNWSAHKRYIIETLLNKGDQKSVSWLLRQTTPEEIIKLLPSLKLDSKSLNFWKIYLQ